MLPDLRAKHALLLQGPVGPFFHRFAAELRRRDVTVTKVNFNAADGWYYRGDDVVRFRGPLEQWAEAFRALVTERRIDAVFLFGDCRPIHMDALMVAAELGVPVWVFEEGYLRPDWITVEQGGVNGNSRMSRDPDFYRQAATGIAERPRAIPIGNSFYHLAWYAVVSAFLTTFFSFRYPHYRHHRDVHAVRQFALWCRGGYRKLRYAIRERGRLAELSGALAGRYFFVPLQVHCDAQFQHSPYQTTEALLDAVIGAFSVHAPAGTRLVLKHHPHDRPYRDYTDAIAELGRRHGCGERVIYVHDLHLPTLLKGARGVVTMNSTVGTSALYHGTPVKVLGQAVYDLPGLTFQGSLAEFFVRPGTVDAELLECFHRWLRHANQVNGSFYRRVSALGTLAGLDAAAFPTVDAEPPAVGRVEAATG